ncbi:MAG: lactate racemase domain-containing protein [Bacillota bacterium]
MFKKVSVPYEALDPRKLAANVREEDLRKDRLEITLPADNLFEIWPEEQQPIVDVAAAVRKALENPVAGPKFAQLIGPDKTIAIITDNQFRATPTARILPTILKMLKQHGIKEAELFTGNGKVFHMDNSQLRDKMGAEAMELMNEMGINIYQNEPFNDDLYTFLGVSTRGTPAFVRTKAYEKDVKLGITLVQANPWGYGGGGPSLIVPGIANNTTIETNHKMCLADNTRVGNVKDNPVKQDKQEIAVMFGLTAVLNVLLNTDGQVVDLVFGSMVEAEKEAIARYNRVYAFDLPELQKEPADIVICGTFAMSNHIFFHTGWGMHNASFICKKGGTIIYASPCPGVASDDGHVPGLALFEPLKRYMPPSQENLRRIMLDVYTNEATMWDGSIWWPYYKVLLNHHFILVTLPENVELGKEIGFNVTTSLQEAIDEALQRHGKNARIAVLPFARMQLPKWIVNI